MTHNGLIIGVSGPTASGKSLLAHTLTEELGSDQVVVISEDSYYKSLDGISMEERNKINFDHPNSMDHDLLIEHLGQLKQGKDVDIPIYDYTIHNRSPEKRRINKHTITVIEGILLFATPALREMMDIRIFMDTPLDICLTRRMRRDILERDRSVDSVLEQYIATVRPMYQEFIEPSKQYADVIIPRGGMNRIAIDIIKAKMKELLKGATA